MFLLEFILAISSILIPLLGTVESLSILGLTSSLSEGRVLVPVALVSVAVVREDMTSPVWVVLV